MATMRASAILIVLASVLVQTRGLTKIPTKLMSLKDFLGEVVGNRYIGLYCFDDDDNGPLRFRLDCKYKTGIKFVIPPGVDPNSKITYVRKSAEIGQPLLPNEPYRCINLSNVEFIIQAQQGYDSKAILVNDDDIFRLFSSDPKSYFYLHVCYDPQPNPYPTCDSGLTFLFIRDKYPDFDDLSLQEVPFNRAVHDLSLNMGIELAPEDFQNFIPRPPYPTYLFKGHECPAAPLDETTRHSKAPPSPSGLPGFPSPGNGFPGNGNGFPGFPGNGNGFPGFPGNGFPGQFPPGFSGKK